MLYMDETIGREKYMDRIKAAAVMEENMKTIFAYALSRVSDKEDAEDLAGEIIVNFLASADKIRDDRAVHGYVWTIAANTLSRFLSRRAKERGRRAQFSAEDGEDPLLQIADPDGEDFSSALVKVHHHRLHHWHLSLTSVHELLQFSLCRCKFQDEYFHGSE